MDTGDGHKIYVEQSGNRDGIPVLFVHGGPGGGTNAVQRRFFDPAKYWIILFDQRGCGNSKPHASLDNNTTQHLLNDMEMIRRDLGIKRWILFGGSWGSTLSLLYAEAYPNHVSGLILRGIFLGRKQELDWFYGGGTKAIFPDGWEDFVRLIPKAERGDLIKAYHKRLTDPAYESQWVDFARVWSAWEGGTVTLFPSESGGQASIDPVFALAFARIEAHYFAHNCFLRNDNQILADAHRITHIPITIVQGRYDSICPPISAWELSKALPNASLRIVPVAGHSAFEPNIRHELIFATDDFSTRDRI